MPTYPAPKKPKAQTKPPKPKYHLKKAKTEKPVQPKPVDKQVYHDWAMF